MSGLLVGYGYKPVSPMPPPGGARTRRHETESKDCNGSSVCRKGGYGRGIMSNPNPQSGLAPLRGLRKQTAPGKRGPFAWSIGLLGSWPDLLATGIGTDHDRRIGLVDPHPIGYPAQAGAVGVISQEMDMALKRFAPLGGRKNLVYQNLISACPAKEFRQLPILLR